MRSSRRTCEHAYLSHGAATSVDARSLSPTRSPQPRSLHQVDRSALTLSSLSKIALSCVCGNGWCLRHPSFRPARPTAIRSFRAHISAMQRALSYHIAVQSRATYSAHLRKVQYTLSQRAHVMKAANFYFRRFTVTSVCKTRSRGNGDATEHRRTRSTARQPRKNGPLPIPSEAGERNGSRSDEGPSSFAH